MYLNYIKILIILGLIVAVPMTYKIYSNLTGGKCDEYFLLTEFPLKDRPLALDRPSQSPHPEGHIEYLIKNDTSINPALNDAYITINGQQRQATVAKCFPDSINRASLANYGSETDYIYLGLIMISLFVYWCFHGYISHKAKVYIFKLEDKLETFADYTVEIKHIGQEITKKDIIEYFSHQEIEVQQVCFVNFVTDTNKMAEDCFNLKKQIKELKDDQNKCEILSQESKNEKKILKIKNKINSKTKKMLKNLVQLKGIIDLQESGMQEENSQNMAFVTFKTPGQKEEVLKKFKEKQSYLQKLMIYIFGVSRIKRKRLENIRINEAEEPADIIWENQAISRTESWIRFILVNVCDFLLFLVLIYSVAFLISVQIELKLDNKSIEQQNDEGHILDAVWKQIGALLFIALLLVLQKIFDKIQPFLVSLQRLKYQSSVMIALKNKYFWSSVIKYLLFLYMNDIFFQEVWQDQRLGGLIFISGSAIDVSFSVLLSFLIVQPMLELINIMRLIQLLKQFFLKCTNFKKLDQKNLNTKMECYRTNINILYTQIDVVWFICMAITPILPYAPLVGIVHLCIIYWIKKYYFVRGCTISTTVDDRIVKKSIKNLLFSYPYFFLGLYHYDLQFKLSVTSDYRQSVDSYQYLFDIYIFWFILSLLLSQFPSQIIWNKLFSIEKTKVANMVFSESQLQRSYNYYNPNYLEEGKIERIKKLISKLNL